MTVKQFAFTTNQLTIEIRNTLELAQKVKNAMAKDAPQKEKDRINTIVTALIGVRTAANKVICPNPYYGFYTVDEKKLRGQFKQGLMTKSRKRAR
jgi:hypothetical protein